MEVKIEESKILRTPSKRSRVFKFLTENPKANISELYYEFPDYNDTLLRVYKSEFRHKYKYKLNYQRLKKKTEEEIENMKKIICLVLDIYEHKTTLHKELTKVETLALDEAESWAGYKEYKKNLIIKEVGRRST